MDETTFNPNGKRNSRRNSNSSSDSIWSGFGNQLLAVASRHSDNLMGSVQRSNAALRSEIEALDKDKG